MQTSSALLGPCGFYEWFGNPGPGIDSWLRNGSWAFAREAGEWEKSLMPMNFDGYWWLLRGFVSKEAGWPVRDFSTPRGFRCLSGDEAACADVVLLPNRQAGYQRVWGGSFVSASPADSRYWWRLMYELGPAESRLLASFVQSAGVERFGQFWRSNESPDDAFRAVTGTSIGVATVNWGNVVYGKANRGPGVGGATLAGSVVIGLAALGLAIRSARSRRIS